MSLLKIISAGIVSIILVLQVGYSQEVDLIDSIVYRTKVENFVYEFYVNKSKLRYSAIVHERDSTHINNYIKGLCAERKIKDQEWTRIDSQVNNLSKYKPRKNGRNSRSSRRSTTSFINAIDSYHEGRLIASYRYPIYPPNSGINSFKSEMLALLKTSGWTHWHESKMPNNYILESDKVVLFEFKIPQENGKKYKPHLPNKAKLLKTITDPNLIEELFTLVSTSKGMNPLKGNAYFDLCNSTDYYILEFHKADMHLKTVYLHDNYFRQYFGYWNKIKSETLLKLFSK